MDADSSYGGSDTAQDSHSNHDHNNSLETHQPHHDDSSPSNTFYHKNEITLPVNCDESDFQNGKPNSPKLPHYLSTANLNINETLENHSNLEELNKKYSSSTRLASGTPSPKKKATNGIDNPAFQNDDQKQCETNGAVKSTFKNGDLNSSASMGLASPSKSEDSTAEAVNLELINLKPSAGKDVAGLYETPNVTNGVSGIPTKKDADVEIGSPYDEYFVPVNEHRKYMR